MTVDYKAQSDTLLQTIQAYATSQGPGLLSETSEAASLLLSWMGYLKSSVDTGVARELLVGAHAAVVEAAGCLSLGLVRPALFSLRAQVDMLLAWLYFKDHPVEWRHAEWTGEGRLRGAVLKDLRKHIPAFKRRLQILQKRKTRLEADPYRLLSAHVHSQTASTTPTLNSLSALVGTHSRSKECIRIQFEVSEFLNDILLACYAERWIHLPSSIKSAVKLRLSAEELKTLCTTILPKRPDIDSEADSD